jgi:hypothetical protein
MAAQLAGFVKVHLPVVDQLVSKPLPGCAACYRACQNTISPVHPFAREFVSMSEAPQPKALLRSI